MNAPTNIFGCTGIGPGLDWGYNVGGAAWIMQNVYDIYRYNGDKKLLRERIYPLMKEVAEFWLEQLQTYRVNVTDDYEGDEYLIVVPSFSAEHGPITKATTYDQTLVRQHFSNTVEIIYNLNISEDFDFM